VANENKIGLAELLHALRMEIERSRKLLVDSGVAPLLKLKDAEVEVQFVVEKEVKAGIGVEIGLFAVDAGGKYHSENLQKLKVTLTPTPGWDGSVAGSGSGE
jgi:hypothetical protein